MSLKLIFDHFKFYRYISSMKEITHGNVHSYTFQSGPLSTLWPLCKNINSKRPIPCMPAFKVTYTVDHLFRSFLLVALISKQNSKHRNHTKNTFVEIRRLHLLYSYIELYTNVCFVLHLIIWWVFKDGLHTYK